MKASEKLLKLEHHHLEVSKDLSNKVMVSYAGAWIDEGACATGACGRGADFESACEDYLNQISGKTLTFGVRADSEKVRIL